MRSQLGHYRGSCEGDWVHGHLGSLGCREDTGRNQFVCFMSHHLTPTIAFITITRIWMVMGTLGIQSQYKRYWDWRNARARVQKCQILFGFIWNVCRFWGFLVIEMKICIMINDLNEVNGWCGKASYVWTLAVFFLLDLCMISDERDECETGEKEIYVNEDYHIPCL